MAGWAGGPHGGWVSGLTALGFQLLICKVGVTAHASEGHREGRCPRTVPGDFLSPLCSLPRLRITVIVTHPYPFPDLVMPKTPGQSEELQIPGLFPYLAPARLPH